MSILENKLKHFMVSFQQLIANHEYYAALVIGLTLPDICTKLEQPEERNTGKRYVKWFDDYMSLKYQRPIGPEKKLHIFLTGNDFYALRCSFLHQGESSIEEQRAREVLNDFVFIEPQPFSKVHLNQVNETLQLQVDVFCVDILIGVKNWIDDHKENTQINERAEKLMEINTEISFY